MDFPLCSKCAFGAKHHADFFVGSGEGWYADGTDVLLLNGDRVQAMRLRRAVVHFATLFGGCIAVLAQQVQLPDRGILPVTLAAGQKQTIEVRGDANNFVVMEIRLEGGLIAVQPPDAPKQILDLGRGGRALFVVPVSDKGTAEVQVISAEQRREAKATVADVTSAYSQDARQSLHAATVAFAEADSARRRQTGAPALAAALKDYDLAAEQARATHEIALQRWILTQKARYLIFQQSTFVEARELLLKAIALPDNDGPTLALGYKTLSTVANFLGDLPASAEAAERSLELYRRSGDVYWQGIVLGNLISTYSDLGRTAEGMRAGHEALVDAEQTQDIAGVVFCLTELAALYREQGEYQRAFESFRQALSWGNGIHYAQGVEAEVRKELGDFYADLGLWDESKAELQRCLSLSTPDGPTVLSARGTLARVLERQGDRAGALHEFQAAITIARKLHLQPEEATLRLERSSVLLRAGDVAEARREVSQSDQLVEELGIPALKIHASFAKGLIEEHDCVLTSSCDRAARDYQKALQLADETGVRDEQVTAYAGIARVESDLQEYASALSSIEHAITIVEHSRANLASRYLAAGYFTGSHALYEQAIDIVFQLDKMHPGEGYAEMAFGYAERARARAMLDAIGERGSTKTNLVSEDLNRRIAANQHRIETQKALLITKEGSKSAAFALHKLYMEQDALDAELEGGHKDRTTDGTKSIKDVQQMLLQRDSELLLYSLGSAGSYRWEITQQKVHISRLPGLTTLQRDLMPLHHMLLSRAPMPRPGEDAEQYRSDLRDFDAERRVLLERIGTMLLPVVSANIHHLYIAADGALASVPWAALRTLCNGHPCYATEKVSISLEPSVSVAVYLMQRQKEARRQRVLVVADTISQRDPAFFQGVRFGPLPGARRETAAIARFVPAGSFQVLRGEEATSDNVGSALSGNDLAILHVAAHTFLFPGHPELAGIALSPQRGGGKSILWLRDVPALHAPRLVTLSGCSTQGGGISGEELSTLTQAFFYAGAEEVIGTIWNVDDRATASLMEAFYRNLLQRRMNAADALRHAQLAMIRRGSDLPDWAGFVVDGVSPGTQGAVPAGNK